MEQKRVKNRATNAQLKVLLNYMISNKIFASGRLYGPVEDAEERQKKEWNNLRILLRKHGPDKSVIQWKTTWRDLKRKMRRLKIDAETLVETINVNTDKPFASQHMVKLDKSIKHESSDEDRGIIDHESSTDLDPLDSSFIRYSVQNGFSVKEEPSTFPSIAVKKKSCSPMQVFVTNTEPPPYNTDPSGCANSSNPPLQCPSSSHHCHCCHRNTLPPGSDHLQSQRNILLQNLCNLLEEQNAILRMRNRIERNKIRYQHHRRL